MTGSNGGSVLAVECKWKEHPGISDTAGLRFLSQAEEGRVSEKIVVCRTKVAYRLDDAWVMSLPDLLEYLVKTG